MELQIYDQRRCDILISRYNEQAANLRHADHVDLWSFLVFMVIQLAIVGWVSTYPPLGFATKAAFLAIDLALMIVCTQLLAASQRHRADIQTTILNINEAFALYSANIYLPQRAISPPSSQQPYIFFSISYWVGLLCVAISIYLGAR